MKNKTRNVLAFWAFAYAGLILFYIAWDIDPSTNRGIAYRIIATLIMLCPIYFLLRDQKIKKLVKHNKKQQHPYMRHPKNIMV